jgi:hypothetical protein
MPIDLALDDAVLHTILAGRVTDEELLAHYEKPAFREERPVWLEIVDGRLITDMAVTPEGQGRLEALASTFVHRLRGGRVAMVASSDVTYGMFRMWQMRREGLDYEVQVFRDYTAARAWVATGAPLPE